MLDSTQLGPLMTPEIVSSLVKYVEEAVESGAKLVCGGQKISSPDLKYRNFFPPTILVDVKQDMAGAQEELFGPVLTVLRCTDIS